MFTNDIPPLLRGIFKERINNIMKIITLVYVCDGFFIDKESKRVDTHRLLLQYSDDRGVNYEFEKYSAQVLSTEDLQAYIGCHICPVYDKYGRIIGLCGVDG